MLSRRFVRVSFCIVCASAGIIAIVLLLEQPTLALAVTPADTLFLPSVGNPLSLDPHKPSGGSASNIARQIFEGLVWQDEAGNVQPNIASAWQISPDSLTYSFTLRSDVYFRNGRLVVAQDFVNSFTRALSPTLGAEADPLYDIAGAQLYHSGSPTATLGITALAPDALRIQLEHPASSFLPKLTHLVASVVAIEDINAGGQNWSTDPLRGPGSGAFFLTEYVSGTRVTLDANPSYFRGYAGLNHLQWLVVPNANAALGLYLNSAVDSVDVSTLQVPTPTLQAEKQFNFVSLITPIWFDTALAPFSGTQGTKLRQALVYSIDMGQIITGALSFPAGDFARGVLAPVIPGYNPNIKELGYHPVSATLRLAESGFSGTAPITLTTNSGNSLRAIIADTAVSDITQTLGITVVSSKIPFGNLVTQISSGTLPVYLIGWIPFQLRDPYFILSLFHSGYAHSNLTAYNNPAFDALVDQAEQTLDPAARLSLYQQAEQLLISDAVVLPTFYGIRVDLVKPNFPRNLPFLLQWNMPLYSVGLHKLFLPAITRN